MTPLWKGPYEDGITFSLLSKFIVCRHRFWLKVVKGMAEPDVLSKGMEYGNFWHEAEQAFSGKKDWLKVIGRYKDILLGRYPTEAQEIHQLYYCCKTEFPLYIDWWAKHQLEVQRVPILEEVSFKVPYELPSGRMISFRGKFDCVFSAVNDIILQENKTKGDIDEVGIQQTLQHNLQVVIYRVALKAAIENYNILEPEQKKLLKPLYLAAKAGGRPSPVLYNVVKRPLADFKSIRKRVGERDSEFFGVRLHANIRDNPKDYFMRWLVNITDKDLEEFGRRTLTPYLEMLCDWWESIQGNPFDPWNIWEEDEEGMPRVVRPNPHHYQYPWGVYNSIAAGFKGDYFDYLSIGRTAGMRQVKTLYPELEGV